jgi:hypothetical protein
LTPTVRIAETRRAEAIAAWMDNTIRKLWRRGASPRDFGRAWEALGMLTDEEREEDLS